MDELETRMRGGLTQLVVPVSDVPDLDEVVTRGRQLRQRRRIGMVAGGTAAALMIAAGVGWAGASGIGLGSQAPVLATPSPVSSTSAGASTTPVLVAPGTTAQVAFLSGPLVDELMAAQVRVSATLLTDGRYSVQAEVVRGSRLDYQHSATNDGHSISWFQVTSKVIIGFVPHRLDWIQYRDKDEGGSFGAFSSDMGPLNELDATVVYRIAGTAGDYAGLRGYLWRDGFGRYYDGDGTLLPSDTHNGATLYLSERLGIFGMVQGGTSASVEESKDRATFIDTWGPEETNTAATSAVLLPAGASRPQVHLGFAGAQVNPTTLGGRILMIATATVPDSTVFLIKSVTYTDADGKLVTNKP